MGVWIIRLGVWIIRLGVWIIRLGVWIIRQVCPLPKQAQVQDYTQGEIKLEKGAEMGRFKLGSTVILCFPEDTVKFLDEIKASSPLMMGQAIA